ncbi:MAG: hypothetical protein CVU05_04290 [Bacteroidetes bacterium HGW-Bacteroidetes-21]|jgi:GWxTD domain-containing protein|nr:MAG: hypothetical protein CVU05_04290 [Bacteroidetes bacterium HGW-Bacteroidetes-21]
MKNKWIQKASIVFSDNVRNHRHFVLIEKEMSGRNIFHFPILLLFLIVSVYSCTTYTPPASKNLNVSYLYNPSLQVFDPQLTAWHNSDKSTTLFVSLQKKNLFFVNDDNVLKAAVRFNYKLYNNKTMKVSDSSNVVLFLPDRQSDKMIVTLNIPTADTVSYLLDLTISDVNKQIGRRVFFTIDRSLAVNTQDYLMVNPEGVPYFSNIVSETDTFMFKHRSQSHWVWSKSMGSNNFAMPYAPHILINYKPFNYKADSTYRLLVTDSTRFTLPYEGFIHFHPDTGSYGGYAVFHYHNHFPEPHNPYRLLQPIRYLTSNKEFDELNLYAEKKNSVDKFWLEATGGNADRSKELIKVYYNRVSFANTFFTSYMEGWKTDRGMLYVVLGLPNTIYKTHDLERWIYGNSQTNSTLTFNFVKRPNPLCNNDFVLSRNESFKISWIQAIDAWRNGRVYSVGG